MVGARSKLSDKGRAANIVGDPWKMQCGGHRQLLSSAAGSLQRKADYRHETLHMAECRVLEAPQRACTSVQRIIGGKRSRLFKEFDLLIEVQQF